MEQGIENDVGGGGLLANKMLWIIVGAAIFLIIGFLVPTPQSMVKLVEEQGFGQRMIDWHVAHDMADAAWKTKLTLAMIPMAIIYFATEALPIGLVGIIMPIFAYFFGLLPTKEIGRTFAGEQFCISRGLCRRERTVPSG